MGPSPSNEDIHRRKRMAIDPLAAECVVRAKSGTELGNLWSILRRYWLGLLDAMTVTGVSR